MTEASSAVTPFKTPRTKQERQWLTHVLRCKESGLSLAAYARSQGLVVNTFYGWHRRLKQRELAQSEPLSPLFHSVTLKPDQSPSTFSSRPIPPPASEPMLNRIEFTPEPLSTATEVVALRFRLPNGIEAKLTGLRAGNCAGFLEALARLRL